MNNLFKNYYDKILVAVAIIFIVATIFMYIWGADFLVRSFSKAIEPKNANNGAANFNIEGAAKLGLIQ